MIRVIGIAPLPSCFTDFNKSLVPKDRLSLILTQSIAKRFAGWLPADAGKESNFASLEVSSRPGFLWKFPIRIPDVSCSWRAKT